mmetsp:Transcript_21887/g.50932  ORF Transcript_21887/g.50932 Transcript_21887/m.50932 type:complete len:99 (+) Transcript_21887:137-433(+)
MSIYEQAKMQTTIYLRGDQLPPRHHAVVPMGQPSSAEKGCAAYATTARSQGGRGGGGYGGGAAIPGRGFARGTAGRCNQGGRGAQPRAPSQQIFNRLG